MWLTAALADGALAARLWDIVERLTDATVGVTEAADVTDTASSLITFMIAEAIGLQYDAKESKNRLFGLYGGVILQVGVVVRSREA
ncbi:hypothetical protein FRC08_002438 [Ceratobasidium sp. 394]|nr:hypothetical protein FRC08_002438 [Ceratobasidium sp. 394]